MTYAAESGGAVPAARAGVGPRFVASLIDGVALGLLSTVLQAVLGRSAGGGLGLIIGLAYYAYLEGGDEGQTWGKKAMNIRVVDTGTGGPIGPGRALLRYVGRIISAIPCGLGYFWALWDPEKQTWHDKIASTYVVPA